MSLFVSKEMNSRETLLHFGQECGKPASTFRDQLEAVMILRVQIIDGVEIMPLSFIRLTFRIQ